MFHYQNISILSDKDFFFIIKIPRTTWEFIVGVSIMILYYNTLLYIIAQSILDNRAEDS